MCPGEVRTFVSKPCLGRTNDPFGGLRDSLVQSHHVGSQSLAAILQQLKFAPDTHEFLQHSRVPSDTNLRRLPRWGLWAEIDFDFYVSKQKQRLPKRTKNETRQNSLHRHAHAR